MASTSSSSIYKGFKYDVFLSFKGEDTRKALVDHLYYALQQKSIHTYKDDEYIKKGKRISDESLKSIENYNNYIIVFSKNYASSSWCLDELVKIMECHKMTEEKTNYPVFYDVEPSEVRKQIGAVGEAFAKHDLAGWELKNTHNGKSNIISLCIYTGSVEVNMRLGQDLLRAADQYLLDRLKRLCEYTIALDIWVDNISVMYDLSEAFIAESLKKACILFVLEHHIKIELKPWFDSLAKRILPELQNHFLTILTKQWQQTSSDR